MKTHTQYTLYSNDRQNGLQQHGALDSAAEAVKTLKMLDGSATEPQYIAHEICDEMSDLLRELSLEPEFAKTWAILKNTCYYT